MFCASVILNSFAEWKTKEGGVGYQHDLSVNKTSTILIKYMDPGDQVGIFVLHSNPEFKNVTIGEFQFRHVTKSPELKHHFFLC